MLLRIFISSKAKNISKMMKKLYEVHKDRKIKVALLIGGQKKSVRERRLESIEMQEADIIIGTHALFEEKVSFKNLGLVVVDEQHRFGVAQRARLLAKGKTPHVLIMSATPIPRTLSMTVYGDLDNSIIDEMPKNRIPIKTLLRGDEKLNDIYKFIRDKYKEGYQSFIVYPLVEESEKLELKAAETYFKRLKEDFLPELNIILINDAHRFGLSQLHQLRGRVGRGKKQAYCILVTKDEYASANNKLNLETDYLSPAQLDKYKSAVRLQTMVKYLDGFKVAEIDLKLRGPGDIFGTKQSGFPELKHVDIIHDTEIIINAKKAAFGIIENNLLQHYRNNLKYASIA